MIGHHIGDTEIEARQMSDSISLFQAHALLPLWLPIARCIIQQEQADGGLSPGKGDALSAGVRWVVGFPVVAANRIFYRVLLSIF